MFFIMGISQKEKKLNFDQLVICNHCGKYGHIEVFMTYTYFMFFFIPIFKWNKQYYMRMSCCKTVRGLDSERGRAIENGQLLSFDTGSLHFEEPAEVTDKSCTFCGFTTTEDYQFCPKCGRQM